jgi:integrase
VLNYFNVSYPKRYKLRDDTKSFTALTDNELKLLLDYVSDLQTMTNDTYNNNLSWALSIYLFLDTGVRISELVKIKFNNIDFDNKIIYLDSTKNGYSRYVFYGHLSEKYLNIMFALGYDHVLWNFNTDKPMDKNSIYHFFTRLNNDLQLRHNIHPHRLRKTFATALLHEGCNLAVISKFLGHRDVKQTMIYLQMDNSLLVEEYAKYYPY